MTQTAPFRSTCPISTTLDIVGDRWSLLIIRDLLFENARSFQEFSRAEEAIATNILTDRLKRMTEFGLIESLVDPNDGRRRLYALTEKGRGLAPVIAEMILWAASWQDTAAPPDIVALIRENRGVFLSNLGVSPRD